MSYVPIPKTELLFSWSEPHVSWSETICCTGGSVCCTSGTICSMTCIICYTQTELRFTCKNHLFFDWTTCTVSNIAAAEPDSIYDKKVFCFSANNLLKRLWTKMYATQGVSYTFKNNFSKTELFPFLYNPPEAKFLDVIGTKVLKVLRVFLIAIHIHLY